MDKNLARGRGKKTFLYKQLAEIIKKEIEEGTKRLQEGPKKSS